MEAGLAQKKAEVDLLTELREEAKVLDRRDGQLGAELEEKRAYYDQFEWSMDMPDEHRLENDVEYRKKLAERQVVVARLAEIEKIANKTYYRR